MAVDATLTSDAAWPERRSRRPTRLTLARAALAALAAAVMFGLALPSPAYRAGVRVVVTDAAAPASGAALKNTADLAVSKSVITEAARSLIGTGYPPPPPSFVERLGLVFGFEWVHPTNADERLAADLASSVAATTGGPPGTLDISAVAIEPDQAAQAATALARALVSEGDAMAAEARRRNEIAAAERLNRLRAAALEARQRFSELGGTDIDPAQAHAAATAQVAVAQARVDALRAIIASGSPPMSDRRDVPPSIEALQASYLDLSRQLSKALETLGERHTTVISLRDEIRSASSALSAEWRRLERVAEAELGTARDRERTAAKAETSLGDGRQGSLTAARIAVEVADARVAQAERTARDGADEGRTMRLAADAAVAPQRLGYAADVRWTLAGLAGLIVFVLVASLPTWRARLARTVTETAATETEPLRQSPANVIRIAPVEARTADRRRHVDRTEESVPALSALLSRLSEIEPVVGTIASVMVATHEADADTVSAALAIGRAAAAAGRRVLVVDGAETRPDLAVAADLQAEPIVADLFGRLRVCLRAEASDGTLYLAPGLEQGARIASGLAAHYATRVVDVTHTFDLLVVDAGCATDPSATAWGPDAVVRVATRLSARDDDAFAAKLDLPNGLMIGTMLGTRFVIANARHDGPAAPVFPAQAPRAAPRAQTFRPTTVARSGSMARPPQRRKIGAR